MSYYKKMSLKKLILLGMSFFITVSASYSFAETATLLNTARKYYYGIGVSKNSNKAFKLYLKAAKLGDVDGMFVVGGMYMQGHGTLVDQKEAFRWLYKAALNGRSSKESQRIIGQSFLSGNNIPQNYKEGLRWYDLAARAGDSEAQSELAYIYFTGRFVERDYDKAKHWFETAARKGYPLAQYNMGILWYTGRGVPQADTKKAYAWFNIAAANGHQSGDAAKNFLKTVLSNKELAEAQQYSMELYQQIKQLKN